MLSTTLLWRIFGAFCIVFGVALIVVSYQSKNAEPLTSIASDYSLSAETSQFQGTNDQQFKTGSLNSNDNLLVVSDNSVSIARVDSNGTVTIKPGFKCKDALNVVGFMKPTKNISCEDMLRILSAVATVSVNNGAKFVEFSKSNQ